MQRHAVHRFCARTKATLTGFVLVLGVASPVIPVWSAEFSVSPIRIQFEPTMRSGMVTVHNTDKRPIRFQLSLVEWTQNAQGEDVYTPSNDLIFFPRQFTVAAGDRGVARVGPKVALAGPEKAYRLRLEELPEAAQDTTVSAINITITFAIPIFIGTTEAKPQALIEPLQMQDGKLTATVQNQGKSQFRIETLEVTGADGYSQQVGGWYLLAGSSRKYALTIPAEVCRKQKKLNLSVKVGENKFTSDLDISPGMCEPI